MTARVLILNQVINLIFAYLVNIYEGVTEWVLDVLHRTDSQGYFDDENKFGFFQSWVIEHMR